MKNKKKTKRFSWYGLIATLLVLTLAGLSAAAIIRSAPRKYDYKTEPSSLLYSLKNGRYTDALTAVKENRAMGVDERTHADYAAPYAACDYYEACTWYEAYVRTGDKENAAVWEAKMQGAYEKMGSLQFMAEEIKKTLENGGKS